MSETCYSCEIFKTFNDKTKMFSETFFNAITPDLKDLLTLFMIVWFAYQASMIMLGRNEKLSSLVHQLIDLTIATVLLQSFSLWNGLFFWFYDLGMSLGVKVLKITSENEISVSSGDVEGLLSYIEESFTPILSKIGVMISDVSWTSLKISLCMVPIAVIYFLLLWRIFASLFMVFVQMFALSLLSPLVCTFYAIPLIKSSCFSMLRIGLANACQILLSCGTIGIIITYLNSLDILHDDNVSLGVGNVGYMQMLFTGSLLWGAYGVILNTPLTLLNAGAQHAPNEAMSFIRDKTRQAFNMLSGKALMLGKMYMK